jgi:hypothetical protein
MSMRELDRLKVIQAVVDGELRAGLAAERLGLCARQVRRLAQRYRIEGPVGLISRHRNRPSNRSCPAEPAGAERPLHRPSGRWREGGAVKGCEQPEAADTAGS